MSTELAWEAVAGAIKRAMNEHGLGQQDLSDLAGISTATLRKLMNSSAGNYRPQTLARVSRALGWPADSLNRVLEGHERAEPPRLSGEETDAELSRRLRLLAPHERRAVARLVDELLKGAQRRPRRQA